MEISEELFDQLVQGLGIPRSDDSNAPVGERRVACRFATGATVRISPLDALSRPGNVELRSLSRSGAAVFDGFVRKVGERLVLHLPRPDGTTVPLTCVVMNTRLIGERVRVGLKFLSRVETSAPPVRAGADGFVAAGMGAEALKLLDSIAAGSKFAAAGREHRVHLNLPAIYSPHPHTSGRESYSVTLRELSSDGGLCVVGPKPLKRDRRFTLTLERRNGLPLSLVCTVVDCRGLDDGSQRIGCRFVVSSGQADRNAGPAGLLGRLRRWLAA